ncbi:MAG: hypothetical protein ACOYXT_11030 [Bacteroidota bacterium]
MKRDKKIEEMLSKLREISKHIAESSRKARQTSLAIDKKLQKEIADYNARYGKRSANAK